MQKLAIAMGAFAFFTLPALAASATSEKSIVVAEEGGVSVHVRDSDREHARDHHVVIEHHRDHDTDRDRHHKIVVAHHHDEHDHDHGDHDHEDHDRR